MKRILTLLFSLCFSLSIYCQDMPVDLDVDAKEEVERLENAIRSMLDRVDVTAKFILLEALVMLESLKTYINDQRVKLISDLDDTTQRAIIKVSRLVDHNLDDLTREIKTERELLSIKLENICNNLNNVLCEESYSVSSIIGISQIYQETGFYSFTVRGSTIENNNSITVKINDKHFFEFKNNIIGNEKRFSIAVDSLNHLFDNEKEQLVPFEIIIKKKKGCIIKKEKTIYHFEGSIVLLPKYPVVKYEFIETYKQKSLRQELSTFSSEWQDAKVAHNGGHIGFNIYLTENVSSDCDLYEIKKKSLKKIGFCRQLKDSYPAIRDNCLSPNSDCFISDPKWDECNSRFREEVDNTGWWRKDEIEWRLNQKPLRVILGYKKRYHVPPVQVKIELDYHGCKMDLINRNWTIENSINGRLKHDTYRIPLSGKDSFVKYYLMLEYYYGKVIKYYSDSGFQIPDEIDLGLSQDKSALTLLIKRE